MEYRNEDGIIIAAFNNGKSNTIVLETLNVIKEITSMANTDRSIKGIVLTGNGKIFSAGFDLGLFLSFNGIDEILSFFRTAEDAFIDLFMCSKPVIAAINGAAIAGGLILSMACDYRIAKNHPKIRIGMSEIKIGLGLSIVQSEIMRYGLDGNRLYRDVMYNGELYDVAKALELGMVDELADEDNLIHRAMNMVKSWSSNPGRGFSLLKETMRKPAENIMRKRLGDENWAEKFNCLLDPDTRNALAIVKKMMGD